MDLDDAQFFEHDNKIKTKSIKKTEKNILLILYKKIKKKKKQFLENKMMYIIKMELLLYKFH